MSITCYDSNEAVINQLYQWDIDRKIHLVGDELTGVSEIHMTNKGQRRAVRVEYATARTGITVTVPNFLLRNTEPLVIYLYQEMGGTEERTVYELQIPIVRRAMPVGYIDSEAWSGSDRVFDTIDLDDYLLAQEGSLRGKIPVLKVLELAGVDALADRVSTIEGKESSWDAKYGADTVGGIPIAALSAETQIEIYAGRQAYNALEYKVDKVEGKGLSDNDYDDSAKAKVDAIPQNPKYTDTTYTAGTGISISDQNVISATGGGGSANAVLYTAQTLNDAQKAQARSNIGAASLSDIGTVFTVKGEVATDADLPANGNTVGDVYYVSSVSAGYVWLETTDHPNGYWEELGEPIDLSAYRTAVNQDAIDASIAAAIPSASSATPRALGTAAAGSSLDYSRADHVHEKPTASDVGAIAAPVSASSGDVLTYDGSAWGAASAPTEVYWCTYGTTTNAEIEAAYSAGKLVCVKYDGRVYVLVGRGSATSHSFSIPYYVSTPAIYSVHCSGNVWNASSKILIGAPSSPFTGDTLVYNGSAWVAQNNAPKYTTLTLATSDWQSSGNAYSCSKTVAGMTAVSIVGLSYSDTETEFSEAQSANTLTFTVAELPSEAITVNVAFMEGSALS